MTNDIKTDERGWKSQAVFLAGDDTWLTGGTRPPHSPPRVPRPRWTQSADPQSATGSRTACTWSPTWPLPPWIAINRPINGSPISIELPPFSPEDLAVKRDCDRG
ncbi:hypothetical protein K0M31_009253 [Melipona bicolor]|uniref:Uncharacterized protein n=1 Tax=Melipona bicolor TaxID=60889 RepID=A0AA40FP68_9HYME|nr:hypothetical protein K0M31_009253 [Melipona bicolor]